MSSHVTGTKNIANVDVSKITDEANVPTAPARAENGVTASPTRKAKDGLAAINAAPAGKPKADAIAGPGAITRTYNESAEGIHTLPQVKKVVERMVVHQRYIKTSAKDGYYDMDTISRETIETLVDVPGAANKPAVAQTELSGSGSNTSDQVVPATAVSEKTGLAATKDGNANKKSSGAMALENLSSAFNEIKSHVGGVQFAPGLTAGINGTFFGPNSFKGFQFGFTGNFIFGENFNIMTELKYFHRINGNYAVNDNYYTYTPTSGGYTRQLQLNSYSFSTLHSMELPVAVRYHTGNFNFYVGGNLVYTFSINTGAAIQPDNSNVSVVPTPLSDNAPKLQASDFNSRFGLGYLLGISYQVSPNVTLDLRNVQTAWDNSKSGGSKIVSDQLYRSPSLQLSLNYRLGGNKNKDKE